VAADRARAAALLAEAVAEGVPHAQAAKQELGL
jgi:hypothetical protein